MQQTETFHTVEEVAMIVGRGKDWLWAQCRERNIPHHKVGRSYRFTDADLRKLHVLWAVVPVTPEADDDLVPSKARRRRVP